MVARVYTRHGGTVGASFDEITSTTPFFEGQTPIIELGNSCQNGAASQGTFTVKDPENTWLTSGLWVPAHTLVRWTEDASGDELWLSQGRVSSEESGRGIVLADEYIEHVITVDDANVDLRGLAFTEDWVRSSETDTDRLYALQAYILDGSSSTSPTFRPSTQITIDDTHLAPDSNTVTLPARTYKAGTQPNEVVDDCSVNAGKVYGVVIHHAGGSHLCLLYILETDHSTYLSNFVIRDDESLVDHANEIYEPIWDQGKGLVSMGQTSISGLVSHYNTDDFVYVNNPTQEDDYEVWIDGFSDPDSLDVTQATARATAIRTYRASGDFTYRFSLLVAADQTHKIAAGMSLNVDTAVVIGGPLRGVENMLRIAVLTWQPAGPDLYWAHMQIGRAYRNMPASRGRLLLELPAGGGG